MELSFHSARAACYHHCVGSCQGVHRSDINSVVSLSSCVLVGGGGQSIEEPGGPIRAAVEIEHVMWLRVHD